MKSILSVTEQSEELLPFQSRKVLLAAIIILLLTVGAFLTSVVFEWELYFFFILFCLVFTILAFYNFSFAFLVVPFTLTNPFSFFQIGEINIHLSELFLLILYIVWIIKVTISRERLIYPKQFLIPTLVIIITAILSLFVARYYMPGMLHIIRYLEIPVVFFLVVVNSCKDYETIIKIFTSTIVGGLIASLVGLTQFLLEIIATREVHRVYGWQGPAYGAVMASIFLLSISALLYNRDKILRFWAIMTIPFTGLALVLSQTRAWIGALLVVFGVMYFFTKKTGVKKFGLIIWIIPSIFLIVFIIAGLGIVDTRYFLTALNRAFRFGASEDRRSMEDIALFMRLNVWRYAIIQYLYHPIFGIGVGNLRFVNYFNPALTKPTATAGWVDNQYIQFFTEAGTFAGIAWILYIFRGMRLGTECLQKSINTHLFAPAIGFFMGLLILFIGSFFWVITPQHELFALLALFLGMLYNINKISSGTVA